MVPVVRSSPSKLATSVDRFHSTSGIRRLTNSGRPKSREPADQHAGPPCEMGQTFVEDLAADIVEEDVDPVGKVFREAPAEIGLPIVDGCIVAELLREPAALVRRPRETDGALRARDPGDLPDDGADAAGRRGDEHAVAFFHAGRVQQAEISRHARLAEHAERQRQRPHVRRDLACAEYEIPATLALQRVVPPAERGHDDVAFAEVLRARADHLAHAAAAHHVPGAQCIGNAGAGGAQQVGALGRAGREAERTHEKLAVAGIRHGLLVEPEELSADRFARHGQPGHPPDAVDDARHDRGMIALSRLKPLPQG